MLQILKLLFSVYPQDRFECMWLNCYFLLFQLFIHSLIYIKRDQQVEISNNVILLSSIKLKEIYFRISKYTIMYQYFREYLRNIIIFRVFFSSSHVLSYFVYVLFNPKAKHLLLQFLKSLAFYFFTFKRIKFVYLCTCI